MGFGLLFIGYFLLLFFPLDSLDLLPNLSIIGCLFMYAGLRRLIGYCPDCRGFVLARNLLIPLSAISIARLALNIAELDAALSESIETYFDHPLTIASAVIICLYSVFLYIAIYQLANSVELPKLASRAVRLITLVSVYTLLEVFSGVGMLVISAASITDAVIVNIMFYTGFFAFILEYICLFAGLAFLFSCYARICLEGDEDMPYRQDIFDKIIAWTKRNKK